MMIEGVFHEDDCSLKWRSNNECDCGAWRKKTVATPHRVAPPAVRCSEWLAAVVEHYPEATIDGPGHCHEVAGRWDEDGSECEWCKTWAEIRYFVKAANYD
jgi:hypothetical protein